MRRELSNFIVKKEFSDLTPIVGVYRVNRKVKESQIRAKETLQREFKDDEEGVRKFSSVSLSNFFIWVLSECGMFH